jgi:putative SOS response-associated peptidase YedK
MCGRYTLISPLDDLLDLFGVPEVHFDYRPRYNIAPSQDAPVLAEDQDGRRIGLLRWGLIPPWADDPAIGSRMINARSETAAEKPSFRAAFGRRRCIVLADGFFEWSRPGLAGRHTEGDGKKVPYWIHLPTQKPFGMAGLWEKWSPAEGDPIYTFTILTTEANDDLRPIHQRMPVILPPDEYGDWLSLDTSPSHLQEMMAPYSVGVLDVRQVSTMVNSPRNDAPECVEPIPCP